MKKNSKILWCVIVLLFELCSFHFIGFAQKGENYGSGHIEEQQQPLSYFNIYRGNSHSHTVFTWTHGAHREEGMTDLGAPTKFHPDWIVPQGMDWKDHNTISLNPEDYTNRQGLPANHFELAIKNGYDFYVITDHTQEPSMQPVSKDNPVWQHTLRTVDEFNKHPGFVALAGFEYSRNTAAHGGDGHINVINSTEYVNADHGQRGPAPPWPEANWSIPKFYGWVKSAKPTHHNGVVATGFNHPKPGQYNDWNHIDDEIVNLISTFEIHTRYNEIRWEAYIRALNKGWKVSPIGVLDNHGMDEIREMSPPTIVLAPELTREAITRALRQRRTFASWIEGVELRYAVNGFIMGSILKRPDKFNFHIEVNTRPSHPAERVRRIQILRNAPDGKDDVEVAAEIVFDGNKDEIVWAPVIEDSSARYFLLRIHHSNDMTDDGNFKPHGSTLSAPVWTGR
jgi:hypothetical protein